MGAEPIPLSTGERIHLMRRRARMSMEQLGEKVGVHFATIAKYEKDHASPTAGKLARLADALNTTTDYLTGRTDNSLPLATKGTKRTRQRSARQNARSDRPIQRPLAAAVR